MRTRSAHWTLALTCLILATILASMAAQASPPRAPTGEHWLPFAGSDPAQPALSVLTADANAIALQAALPGCMAEEVTADGQTYTRLYGEGYGHGSKAGRPDLPVLRRDVEVPFGAQVTLELVQATYRDYTLAELGLAPIYPLQPPVPKIDGAENRSLTIDGPFYAAGDRFPAAPLALGQEYIVRGHRVQPVEVWPVAYDPAAGTVRLYSSITFRLRLQGSDVGLTAAQAARYASPAYETRLAGQILNYNQGRPARQFGPDAPVGYLIITADAYYDAIQPLAALRQARGYDVTVAKCADIGGCTSTAPIQAYIEDAYDTWPVPPSYVLLVGDTNTVATYSGPVIGTATDLYYGCMDGASDWHPEIGRGRFPVRSPAQTTIMVDKYLAYADLTGQEPWLKKAAFPATCDNYTVAEGTHNYVINSYTGPGGYSGIFPNNPNWGGDQLYCITYNADHGDLVNSFNDHRWAIIYSGHGGHDGWEMGFSSGDVQSLTNYGSFPFVASHACVSGDFGQVEVFGETWVLQQNKGALAYWGSSTNSYWGEDDVLERAMFDSLFAPGTPHATTAQMTDAGLDAVEAAYPGSARYYRETYNVLGDPAVRIFIEPELATFMLNVAPTAHHVCGSGTVTSSVVIGSVLGYSETVYLTAAAPAAITATLAPDAAPAPFTATLTLEVAAGTPPGDYTIQITATDAASLTQTALVAVRVADSSPDAPTLLSPADGATNTVPQPTLVWDAAAQADEYSLQVATEPGFGTPVVDLTAIMSTSHTLASPLDLATCYFWRVQGDNACGTGAWALPFRFATVALQAIFQDNIESGGGHWTHQAAQGTDHWTISTAQSHSPTHAWFVPDDSVVTDSRLWNSAAVPIGAGSTLSFWHRYQFEGTSYDGSVLEISTNGGGSWSDLGPYITANGYNGTIDSGYYNPLAGRDAWTGDLTTWTRVTVDLNSFAGQNANIRWRIGCDSGVSDVGWYIDDVEITFPLPPHPAPGLLSVEPNQGTPYAPTPVTITGLGFLATPLVLLDGTALVSVTCVSSTTLQAVVPAGLPEDVYDLTVINPDCQGATLVDAFTISGQCTPPEISLAASSPVELGQPMHFTATLVSGTTPVSYDWDLGGPGSGTGLDTATPVYTYTAYGDFAVLVTATNACDSDVATATVTVECTAPTASFASDSPVALGQPMHFTSTVSGTGPLSYTWDLGDGLGTSVDPHPVYTYTAAGDYAVTLTVEGPCGTAAFGQVVTVLSECLSPTASFASDSPVTLGQPMHFTSTVGGTGPFSYAWAFGDGLGTSSDPHPVYTYTAAGDYTVTLTVTGLCGQATATMRVTAVDVPGQYAIYLPILVVRSSP